MIDRLRALAAELRKSGDACSCAAHAIEKLIRDCAGVQGDSPRVHDYTTVPAGRYVCRVAEVRVGRTRAGDARWALCLEVAEGDYEGRLAAWDALVFSTLGSVRVRRILNALGVSGGMVSRSEDPSDIAPRDVEGRTALVEVRHVEFATAYGGETIIRRNEVPYDGWRKVQGDSAEVQG